MGAWLFAITLTTSDRPIQETLQICVRVFSELNEKHINRCLRECDLDGWWCRSDQTTCMWNDGNNTCTHPGESLTPLEDD